MILSARSFEDADETRPFERGQVAVVDLGGRPVSRMTFDPGWLQYGSSAKATAGANARPTTKRRERRSDMAKPPALSD